LDCSPVSNKNFSEILPSNGLGPGPGEVGQGSLKVSTYDITHKKSATPKQKFFFIANYKTCQVFSAFGQLSNALGTELHSCKAMCDPVVLAQNA